MMRIKLAPATTLLRCKKSPLAQANSRIRMGDGAELGSVFEVHPCRKRESWKELKAEGF